MGKREEQIGDDAHVGGGLFQVRDHAAEQFAAARGQGDKDAISAALVDDLLEIIGGAQHGNTAHVPRAGGRLGAIVGGHFDEAGDADAGPGVALQAEKGGLSKAGRCRRSGRGGDSIRGGGESAGSTVDAALDDQAGHEQGKENGQHAAGEWAGREIVNSDDQKDPDQGVAFKIWPNSKRNDLSRRGL